VYDMLYRYVIIYDNINRSALLDSVSYHNMCRARATILFSNDLCWAGSSMLVSHLEIEQPAESSDEFAISYWTGIPSLMVTL
jgi:hypothetical protein